MLETLNEAYNRNKDKFFSKSKRYYKKPILNPVEINILEKLKAIYDGEYYILPQVCLGAYIETPPEQTREELYRFPDFLLCDLAYNPVAIIEINGATHKTPYKRLRDMSVNQISRACGIPFIQITATVHTSNETLREILDCEIKRITEVKNVNI